MIRDLFSPFFFEFSFVKVTLNFPPFSRKVLGLGLDSGLGDDWLRELLKVLFRS